MSNSEKTQLPSNEVVPGPLWIPTIEVERMMRECQSTKHSDVKIDRKKLEGLLHDSLLWRQERATQKPHGNETSEQLSSGDAIACISMALQNPPDTQEWARLLSDCRYVIEKLEDELLAAKRSRNDEQRLRKGAESHSIKAITIPSGCTYPACDCGDITRCKANTQKANSALCNCGEFCNQAIGSLFTGKCRRKANGLPVNGSEQA